MGSWIILITQPQVILNIAANVMPSFSSCPTSSGSSTRMVSNGLAVTFFSSDDPMVVPFSYEALPE
jgi:hypothetical protein